MAEGTADTAVRRDWPVIYVCLHALARLHAAGHGWCSARQVRAETAALGLHGRTIAEKLRTAASAGLAEQRPGPRPGRSPLRCYRLTGCGRARIGGGRVAVRVLPDPPEAGR